MMTEESWPVVSFEEGDSPVTTRHRVPWDEREAAMNAVLGYDGTLPIEHPDKPGWFAYEAEMVPEGKVCVGADGFPRTPELLLMIYYREPEGIDIQSLNLEPFDGFPPGTVRFQDAKAIGPPWYRRLWNWLRGRPSIYQATYRFEYRAGGWDHVGDKGEDSPR